MSGVIFDETFNFYSYNYFGDAFREFCIRRAN